VAGAIGVAMVTSEQSSGPFPLYSKEMVAAVMVPPVMPLKAKLNVGREPETKVSRPVISNGVARETALFDQPETVAPWPSRTVRSIDAADPVPTRFEICKVLQRSMPSAVEQAYLGANCEGCRVMTGFEAQPAAPVQASKFAIFLPSLFTHRQAGFSGSTSTMYQLLVVRPTKFAVPVASLQRAPVTKSKQ